MVPPFLGFIIIQITNHHSVVESTSSTAALGYIMAPLLQTLIALPIGVMVGFLFKSVITKHNKKET